MKNRRRVLCWLLVCLLTLPMVGPGALGFSKLGLSVSAVYAAGPAQEPTPNPGTTNAGAFLDAPDIGNFPQITMHMKVHDAQGSFVHGLTADRVTILENAAPRTVTRLEEQRGGAQVVVALNPGPSFAIRNAKAISRYDLIKDALRAWANSRMGSTIDDLSLLIAGGPAASHTSNPVEWLSALSSEQIDPRQSVPNLDVLFRAVSLASDPTPRPGMSRAVIFITPPPEGQQEGSLENLAAQARDSRTAIYIWLVASSGAFSTQSAQQLVALSQGTGGRLLNFTGEEALPSLETYLAALRDIYLLEYQSGVKAGGTHEVAVQVQAGEASIQSPPVTFEMNLQPPQPAFVTPPLEVHVSPVTDESSAVQAGAQEAAPPMTAAELSGIQPSPVSENRDVEEKLPITNLQPLEVVFSFPDGRMRPLVYTALLVDGEVVDENLAPPFDHFTWNLDGYSTSGLHRLQVQARDTLGLTGTGTEHPVQVTVIQPEQSPLGGFQRNLPIMAALMALLAGALLVLVLVVGGQLSPRAIRTARRRRRNIDPVTQPVQIQTEAAPARRAGWTSRLQWPGKDNAPSAEAYLNPLPDAEDQDTLPPIPVASEEITIGSDSNVAGLLLDDPSVEALHARLYRGEDGSYRLADEGSVAGTWINYTPVSREGAGLEHGDLIHIGRIGFRFTLRKPATPRKPVIIEETPPKSADNPPETATPVEDETEARPPVETTEEQPG